MKERFEVGVVKKLEPRPEQAVPSVHSMGFRAAHLSLYEPSFYSDELASLLQRQCEEYQVSIDALWVGWPGHVVWDFVEGPSTIGLVPPHLRAERATIIKQGADFAARLGIKQVITHVGFIPEDMHDEKYTTLIPILADLARHCQKNGQEFLFETGQETPVTLLRTIEDIGESNVGINLDPANLILYGTGNPVDALDVFGHLVRGVHIKDGVYPTNGKELGQERAVGKGKVDFAALLKGLKSHSYAGKLYIECELPTDDIVAEIRKARTYIDGLVDELFA
jgi:L-ribulose-5-phosphate 3-epimerase